MWSNGFYRTIELASADRAAPVVRLFGGRVASVVAQASGSWSLRLVSRPASAAARGGALGDEWLEVRLTHGWIAVGGRLIGLRWVARDGRRFSCWLWCRRPGSARWRRLLVRLRVPMAAGLA